MSDWDRVAHESPRAYEAFRQFRDLGPLRVIDAVQLDGVSLNTIKGWASRYRWKARAIAWDDRVYREADSTRLEALREMQRNHAAAGRVAMAKALGALQAMSPTDIPPSVAVRLLDVGTRLERSTLAPTLAQLQGVEPGDASSDDPWETIARELSGSDSALRHAETD